MKLDNLGNIQIESESFSLRGKKQQQQKRLEEGGKNLSKKGGRGGGRIYQIYRRLSIRGQGDNRLSDNHPPVKVHVIGKGGVN